MKTINEILENYKDEYEVCLEDRFGKRFAQFLPDDLYYVARAYLIG